MPGRKPKTDVDLEIGSLEGRLKQHFEAVKPDPSFVHHLQRRLVAAPDVIIETRPREFLFLIPLGLGLFAGVFGVWLWHKLREDD